LQEEEAANGLHGNETVAWLAVENTGTGSTDDGVLFETVDTGIAVSHASFTSSFASSFGSTPAFLASTQTFRGGDPYFLRSRFVNSSNYRIYLDEETSADAEVLHVKEQVGIFAIETGLIQIAASNSPLNSFASDQGSYLSGTNTPEAWAAYEEMLAWGEDSLPFAHDEHEHEAHSELSNALFGLAALTPTLQSVDAADESVDGERAQCVAANAGVAAEVQLVTSRPVRDVDMAFANLPLEGNEHDGQGLVDLDSELAAILRLT
jgi:hypothetical protein